MTKTLLDGSFHFSKVLFPYTINITGNNDNSLQSTAYVFNGLTIINPTIKLKSIEQSNLHRNSIIHLKTPDTINISSKKYAVVAYDSTGTIMNRQDVPLMYDGNIYVYWSGGQETMNANIFLIAYYSGYERNYFDRYAERQITVINGEQSNIVLDSSEFKIVDEVREVKFYYPPRWNYHTSGFGFTFNNLLANNLKGVYTTAISNQQYASVFYPFINNKKLYYFFDIEVSSTDYSYYHLSNLIIPVSGINLYLSSKPLPALFEPSDNAININYKTSFKISDDDKSGMYVFDLKCYNPFYDVKLYTKNISFNYPFFHDTNFVLRKNATYLWNVLKYFNVKSVDEFISNNNIGNLTPSEYCGIAYKYFNTGDTLK